MKKYRIRPEKKAGQTFLTDDSIAKRIVEAAELSKSESVLEIGGGLGALTRWLAKWAGQVYVVEIDKRLVHALKDLFNNFENVTIIRGDALKVPLPKVDKVVSNLPYRLSSELTFRLLKDVKFRLAVLMYQQEFANRLLAEPGSSEYSRLTINVRYLMNVEYVMDVPAEKFYPVPAVNSTVVKMWPRADGLFAKDERIFNWMVQGIYAYPNKQVRKALRIWFKNIRTEKSQVDYLLEQCKHFLKGTAHLRSLTLEQIIKMSDKVLNMVREGKLPFQGGKQK